MKLGTWDRKWWKRTNGYNLSRTARPKRPERDRLALEVLEARCLPSSTTSFSAALHTDVGTHNLQAPLVAVDLNGDGKTDLVIADRDNDRITVLMSMGDGSFAAPAYYNLDFSPQNVQVADFNGDNKADLYVPTVSGPYILFGNGNGTFQTPVLMTGLGSGVVGDFYHHNKPDVIWSSDNLNVAKGNGNGTFQAAVTTTLPAGFAGYHSNQLFVGDYNGDGNQDVLYVGADSTGHYTSYIFYGNGDGTFQKTPYSIDLGEKVAQVADLTAINLTNMGDGTVSNGGRALTLNPGIYSSISITGVSTTLMKFNPGIYIIEGGGLTMTNGTVSGTGVTIINAGTNYPLAGGTYGAFKFSSVGAVKLTPPSSGPYAGIALWQPADNTKTITVNQGQHITLTGRGPRQLGSGDRAGCGVDSCPGSGGADRARGSRQPSTGGLDGRGQHGRSTAGGFGSVHELGLCRRARCLAA